MQVIGPFYPFWTLGIYTVLIFLFYTNMALLLKNVYRFSPQIFFKICGPLTCDWKENRLFAVYYL